MSTPNSRVVLVTGANKGIGYEVARQIGKTGATILVGARNPSLGEAAATTLQAEGVNAHFIQLDVCNPESIEAAAAKITADYGHLDVLVNNAGVTDSADGFPGKASLTAVRRIFETNFFGVAAVTQALLPLILKSESGRIVNVSSGLGSLGRNSDPTWQHANVKRLGYNSSKAALNMMTVLLAAELAGTGIKVNTVDPGYTATDLNNHSGYQTVAEGAEAAIRMALLDDDGPTGGFFSSAGPEPW